MGTRADFYIGRGAKAEWIGSVAWDGYQWAEDPTCEIASARTEEEFVAAVTAEFRDRKDVTLPADGWPWPWNDSNTTDYAYCFDEGGVHAYCFGVLRGTDGPKATWPDMSDVKNVTYGPRSGVIVIGR